MAIRQAIPLELITHILSLFNKDATDGRHTEPAIAFGEQNTWQVTLNNRKNFLLVCRSWWFIGHPDLYRHIYIHRVGQLCALVRTLKTASLRSPGDLRVPLDYASLIKRVDGRFFIPHDWEEVYKANAADLFSMCTSLQTLSWTPLFEFFAYDSPDRVPGCLGLRTSSQLPLLQHLKKLTFNAQNTTFTSFEAYPPISFAGVEDLTCEILYPAELTWDLHLLINALDAESWKVPSLRRLTLRMELNQKGYSGFLWQEFRCVGRLLKKIGTHLTFLDIKLKAYCPISRPEGPMQLYSVFDVLKHCPVLEELRYPCHNFLAFGHGKMTKPYKSLQRVLLPVILDMWREFDAHNMDTHLEMYATRDLFPAVNAVVLTLYAMEHITPTMYYTSSIVEDLRAVNARRFLARWMDRYEAVCGGGIALLASDGQPVLSDMQREHGKWRFDNHKHDFGSEPEWETDSELEFDDDTDDGDEDDTDEDNEPRPQRELKYRSGQKMQLGRRSIEVQLKPDTTFSPRTGSTSIQISQEEALKMFEHSLTVVSLDHRHKTIVEFNFAQYRNSSTLTLKPRTTVVIIMLFGHVLRTALQYI